jgi:hypothetical protein
MRICLAVILVCVPAAAGAEMWKCVDADGNTRYTNVRADVKGCKPLNLEPPPPAQPAAARSQAQQPQQPKPANFPSVDNETQKQRDAGRRKILEQELAQEQQQLDAAKKQLTEQQELRLGTEKNFARVEERLKPFEARVKLHESNIDSLKRELGNIR